MVTVLILLGTIGLFAGTLSAAFGNDDTPLSKAITALTVGTTLLVVLLAYLHINFWAAGAMFSGFALGTNLGTAFVRQPS